MLGDFVVKIVHFLNNFDTEIVHTSKLNPFQIWKTILKIFAALFKQQLNFRIFWFLKFFAKSINKLTRGDYGVEVQLSKLNPIPQFDRIALRYKHSTVLRGRS